MKEIFRQLESSWQEVLVDELSKKYIQDIGYQLEKLGNLKTPIYPPQDQVFKALELTPFDQLKVVIIGQDPYHNPGQAMGLSFSVPQGHRIPPSLRNIYKELLADLSIPVPIHGDLSNWASQGILLLNAVLTVEEKKPGSHKKLGWQEFTDAVISKISEQKEGVIFLLWGNFAKTKMDLIDQQKHHILTAAHPSPLARMGFKGCRHFSKTNELLEAQGLAPIDWSLTSEKTLFD